MEVRESDFWEDEQSSGSGFWVLIINMLQIICFLYQEVRTLSEMARFFYSFFS